MLKNKFNIIQTICTCINFIKIMLCKNGLIKDIFQIENYVNGKNFPKLGLVSGVSCQAQHNTTGTSAFEHTNTPLSLAGG